jgi:hypothetical protein
MDHISNIKKKDISEDISALWMVFGTITKFPIPPTMENYLPLFPILNTLHPLIYTASHASDPIIK